ncbi:DNA polymerase III subunit beta [Virgibacillus halodenitrificans]|uniref:DNA polymerase III subunit beta n=1 Tax=Virgibacillus halodenitrificans TaxID=1482 RepID=UPI000EF44D46|nr:DNA polymerase III subunit beta [Virgibacillus halodenitrificans]
MKTIINRNTLVKSVNNVMKAISARTTIPALTGIKVEATTEGITLKGSDSDISISVFIPLEKEEKIVAEVKEVGDIVLQAKLFSEIIRKLPEDEVIIETGENFIASVRSGSVNFDINGFDPEEYPRFPIVDKKRIFQVPQSTLKNVIQTTVFAASDAETRPILTGVCWDVKEQLLATATDSHRLSNKKIPVNVGSDLEMKVVIPKKSLNELSKLLDDSEEMISVMFTDKLVLFKTENLYFYSRLLEGNFPDTSRLIPKESKSAVKVIKRDFTQAIERASLLAKESQNHVIKLVAKEDGNIQISSKSAEIGTVVEDVSAQSIEGDEVKVSFSAKYMLEALKAISTEDIIIYFNGAMKPFLIKPIDDDTTLQLLLPVRTY